MIAAGEHTRVPGQEDMRPEPDRVSHKCMIRFRHVLQAAPQLGLRQEQEASPAYAFNGWMGWIR
jgi:hypothetical protein